MIRQFIIINIFVTIAAAPSRETNNRVQDPWKYFEKRRSLDSINNLGKKSASSFLKKSRGNVGNSELDISTHLSEFEERFEELYEEDHSIEIMNDFEKSPITPKKTVEPVENSKTVKNLPLQAEDILVGTAKATNFAKKIGFFGFLSIFSAIGTTFACVWRATKKAFQKQPELGERVPEPLKKFLPNADLA